jgi:hypothetical protein
MEMREWIEHLEDLNYGYWKRDERKNVRKERGLNEGIKNRTNERKKELMNMQAVVWILSRVCV